jgi:hypothetical protein
MIRAVRCYPYVERNRTAMRASIEHWSPAKETAWATLTWDPRTETPLEDDPGPFPGPGNLTVEILTEEYQEPRGWHTDRTDPAIRAVGQADIMDENGEPTGPCDLTDDAREAISEALTPEWQQYREWRGY